MGKAQNPSFSCFRSSSHRSTLLILALSFIVVKTANSENSCSSFVLDGAAYDLTPLVQETSPYQITTQDASGETTLYFANICGKLDAISYCKDQFGAPNAVALAVNKNCVVLGEYATNEAGYTPWRLIDASNPELGIQAVFTHQPACKASIKIECDADSVYVNPFGKTTLKSVSVSESNACQVDLLFSSSLACPKKLPDDAEKLKPAQENSSSSSNSGRFFFFVVLGFVLYCGLGVAFNVYRNDREGVEAIPNLSFWAQVGSTVRDGAAAIYTSLSELTGGQNRFESPLPESTSSVNTGSGGYQNV